MVRGRAGTVHTRCRSCHRSRQPRSIVRRIPLRPHPHPHHYLHPLLRLQPPPRSPLPGRPSASSTACRRPTTSPSASRSSTAPTSPPSPAEARRWRWPTLRSTSSRVCCSFNSRSSEGRICGWQLKKKRRRKNLLWEKEDEDFSGETPALKAAKALASTLRCENGSATPSRTTLEGKVSSSSIRILSQSLPLLHLQSLSFKITCLNSSNRQQQQQQLGPTVIFRAPAAQIFNSSSSSQFHRHFPAAA